MSVWDDPDINPSGDYVKFENPGDKVTGVITSLGKHTWDDGKVSAKVGITTDAGDDVTLTAGQYRLKIALAEARPEVGDHIAISFDSIEKLAGGKTAKNFTVNVARAGQAARPAAGDTSGAPF